MLALAARRWVAARALVWHAQRGRWWALAPLPHHCGVTRTRTRSTRAESHTHTTAPRPAPPQAFAAPLAIFVILFLATDLALSLKRRRARAAAAAGQSLARDTPQAEPKSLQLQQRVDAHWGGGQGWGDEGEGRLVRGAASHNQPLAMDISFPAPLVPADGAAADEGAEGLPQAAGQPEPRADGCGKLGKQEAL